MKRILMALVATGTLAVGTAAKADWGHCGPHHHHDCYRPARAYYYYPPPAPVVYAPYYPAYYPGSSVFVGGRNFSVGFNW